MLLLTRAKMNNLINVVNNLHSSPKNGCTSCHHNQHVQPLIELLCNLLQCCAAPCQQCCAAPCQQLLSTTVVNNCCQQLLSTTIVHSCSRSTIIVQSLLTTINKLFSLTIVSSCFNNIVTTIVLYQHPTTIDRTIFINIVNSTSVV